jgi:hypothetical protein
MDIIDICPVFKFSASGSWLFLYKFKHIFPVLKARVSDSELFEIFNICHDRISNLRELKSRTTKNKIEN